MSVYTDTRAAIRDALAGALGLDFVDGSIEGPLRDVSIGCIYPDGDTPLGSDANFVEFRMVARILLALDPHVSELEPDDPASLETCANAAILAVASAATTGTLVGTFVTYAGSQYDVDTNSVDLYFVAQIPNPYDPA